MKASNILWIFYKTISQIENKVNAAKLNMQFPCYVNFIPNGNELGLVIIYMSKSNWTKSALIMGS